MISDLFILNNLTTATQQIAKGVIIVIAVLAPAPARRTPAP